ncbi:MAG: SET domain-containing protein, partial [Akkermansiaceae bacterium]
MAKNKDQKRTPEQEAKWIEKMRRRGESDFVEVRDSVIHGRGVYCCEPIKKEQYFIEYVGNRINKEESERRAWKQYEEHEKSGAAAVYIFNLTRKWDLDGNVEWNPARLINHSCEPNSEAIQ